MGIASIYRIIEVASSDLMSRGQMEATFTSVGWLTAKELQGMLLANKNAGPLTYQISTLVHPWPYLKLY